MVLGNRVTARFHRKIVNNIFIIHAALRYKSLILNLHGKSNINIREHCVAIALLYIIKKSKSYNDGIE